MAYARDRELCMRVYLNVCACDGMKDLSLTYYSNTVTNTAVSSYILFFGRKLLWACARNTTLPSSPELSLQTFLIHACRLILVERKRERDNLLSVMLPCIWSLFAQFSVLAVGIFIAIKILLVG